MADLNAKYGYHGEESKKRPGGLPMRIEPFTPHQLRHTFCTLMYFAGVDVLTARDQMGHKDISVTLGIYTSLDKKFKKKKINRLDSYLKKTDRLICSGAKVAHIVYILSYLCVLFRIPCPLVMSRSPVRIRSVAPKILRICVESRNVRRIFCLYFGVFKKHSAKPNAACKMAQRKKARQYKRISVLFSAGSGGRTTKND